MKASLALGAPLVFATAVTATSSKMDFLALGHVRTDPVTDPASCSGKPGLSAHVHTYYGATASLRPTTAYEEMRAACSNSGNIKENKSLYWHPSIYRFDKSTGLYNIETPVFATAYYIWRDDGDGVTKAFPNGFQMIARQGNGAKTRAEFNCAGSDDLQNVCNPSERAGGDCTPLHTCAAPVKGDGDSYAYQCFPPVQCSELEIKIVFPACSNGEKTSDDHMSHVAYAEGDWSTQEEGFNAECPSTHPIRIPEVQMYFRLYNYQGGAYTFSDGTSTIHTDYFSGWDEEELQKALDGCSKDKDVGGASRGGCVVMAPVVLSFSFLSFLSFLTLLSFCFLCFFFSFCSFSFPLLSFSTICT